MPAMGQRLPLLLRWQHVRCTPDSCRLDAPPKSAALGHLRTLRLQSALVRRALSRRNPASPHLTWPPWILSLRLNLQAVEDEPINGSRSKHDRAEEAEERE